MDSDRPLKPDARDRLGFTSLAEKLARLIMDQSSKDGLVLGIEGEWGSGKSSLLALLKATLEQEDKKGGNNDKQMALSPAIVDFKPWLISDRDRLIGGFLTDLAHVLASKYQEVENIKETIKKLRQYAVLISSVGSGAKLLGYVIPGVGWIGEFLKPVKKLFDGQAEMSELTIPTLEEQKKQVCDSLKKCPQQIIVIIDDLDRLEPKEAAEVMRLIKAVADFPNIIYVLAYDAEIVGHLLEQGLKVKSGKAYLEKIVQVSFRIPKPEGFDLRNWLKEEVSELFSDELKADTPQEPFSLQSATDAIINEWGKLYLKTPRHVVRTLNAIKLHGLPVKDEIYIPDMIFLQLVRLGNPELYEWIEEYVMIAVTSKNWSTEQQRTDLHNRLIEIFPNEDELYEAIHSLGDRLPGISRDPAAGMFESDEGNEKKFHVLNMRGDDFDPFIRDHRLASPDHYLFYFALTQPEGILLESEVQAFIVLVQKNRQRATGQFKKYATKPSQQGKNLAEWLLNRLYILDMHVSSPLINNRCNLLKIMADIIDEMEIKARKNFCNNVLHKQAVLLGERLLKRLPRTEPSCCMKELLEKGKSLGWLTEIYRDEIIAHGLVPDITSWPEEKWLFTADEFEQTRQIMLNRYRSAKPTDLLCVPDPISLLFGWQQGSDKPEEVKAWVQKQTKTDKDLLDFLTRIRSRGEAKRVSRGNGILTAKATKYYYSLNKNDLEHFMVIEKVKKRLTDIAEGKTNQATLAKEHLEAFANASRRRRET